MQLKVLLVSIFLSFILILIVRFIFPEINLARELAEIITCFISEFIVSFFVFFTLFKNDKNTTFKQFCADYSITLFLRYIFCIVFSFALYIAGPAISLLGVTITELFFSNDIIVVSRDVPKLLYTAIFILFESLTFLSAYCAYKSSEKKRKILKEELLNGK